MNAEDVLTWSAIVMFGVSAVLWVASTLVKISAEHVVKEYQKVHGPNSGPAQIVDDDGSDFVETVKLQSRWNRWAALATATALGLQAVAIYLNPT